MNVVTDIVVFFALATAIGFDYPGEWAMNVMCGVWWGLRHSLLWALEAKERRPQGPKVR